MKQFRMLKAIMKRTHADKLLYAFIGFFLVAALIIMLIEPGIDTYGESVWYCYTMAVTIGFGDFIAVTIIGRILSIIISLYALLMVGMIPAIVVSYYLEVIKIRERETSTEFIDKLEHLQDLSKEELTELSARVKKFKKK